MGTINSASLSLLMIFWVNACRSFTLEKNVWKSMRFCLGSLKIESILAKTGTELTVHIQHWTRKYPPSEPPSRLWSYCRVIVCTAGERKGVPPCLETVVFLSPSYLRQEFVMSRSSALSSGEQRPRPCHGVFSQQAGMLLADWGPHGTGTLQYWSGGHRAPEITFET